MYRRTKEYIKSNKVSPDIFIQGQDYCNSELLLKLDQITEYQEYTITKYEHRVDLISYNVYGNVDYSWIILYVNRCTNADLVRGKLLKIIPKSTLTQIISSI